MKKIFSLVVIVCISFSIYAGNNGVNAFSPVPLPAYKSNMKNKTFAGIVGGYNMYMGNYCDSISGMAGFGLRAKYFVSNNWAVSGDFGVSFGKTKITGIEKYFAEEIANYVKYLIATTGDSTITFANPYSEIKNPAYSIPITFNLEYYLANRTSPAKFKGYVGLGFGYIAIYRKVEALFDDDFARSNDPYLVQMRRNMNLSMESYNKMTGNFLLAPKVGFLWTPNEYFGITGEAKFSAIFAKEFVPGLSFNAGILFQLSNKRN